VTARRALYGMGRLVAISGAHEAMPYPLIEAMLCGRATICTDNGGLAATVGVGALVVPPGDPARLAAACASVLTDQRLRHELAVAGRDRARSLFSLSACSMDTGRCTRRPRPASRRRTSGWPVRLGWLHDSGRHLPVVVPAQRSHPVTAECVCDRIDDLAARPGRPVPTQWTWTRWPRYWRRPASRPGG